MLLKLSNSGTTESVISIIKSLLTDRSLNVVAKVQFSGILSIYVGVPQGSLLGTNVFLFYINGLPKIILRSFISIDADYPTIYGCNVQIQSL